MSYEQKAVHAKQYHEEDGRVKIDMQDIAVQNTNKGRGLCFLSICIEVRETWQRAEENKVGQCQAEDVNIAALPLWQTKYVAKYNQKVAKETNTELDGIRWCQVVLLQHVIYLCTIESLRREKQIEKTRREEKIEKRRKRKGGRREMWREERNG